MTEGNPVQVILKDDPLHARLALDFVRVVGHQPLREVPLDPQGEEGLYDFSLDSGLAEGLNTRLEVKCIPCQLHGDRAGTLSHRPGLEVQPYGPGHAHAVDAIMLKETLIFLSDESINQLMGDFLNGNLAPVFHEHPPDFTALAVQNHAWDLNVING